MEEKKVSDIFSSELRPMLAAGSVGIVFVVSILLGTAIGYWLDMQFDTKPWLTLFFLCMGIAAGVKNVLIFIRKAEALERKREKDKNN